MDKLGAIVGRFQIFHNDHLKYLLARKSLCKDLIIGITNPDPSHFCDYFLCEFKLPSILIFVRVLSAPFNSSVGLANLRRDIVMYMSFLRSISLVVTLIWLLGCAAVEPQRKESIESTPKVKEEDITDNKSPSQVNQPQQNMGPSGAFDNGQQINTLSPVAPDPGGGKAPRRFIWKDKN